MTPEDMNRIVRLAHVEANRTPEDLALLFALWWEVLAPYQAEEVQAAVVRFMAESPWPPKVSQILDLLNGTDSTTAGNARAAVMAMARAGKMRVGSGRWPAAGEFPNEAARLAAREIGVGWSQRDEASLARAFDEAYARHSTILARLARETAGELTAGGAPARSLGMGE